MLIHNHYNTNIPNPFFLKIRIIFELVNKLRLKKYYEHGNPEKHIAILSQYKAQCSAISEEKKELGLEDCNISTVVASQGW